MPIQVYPIPVLSDNFAYAIFDDSDLHTVLVVDPAEPSKVLDHLSRLSIPSNAIKYVLTTHKHWDHSGGNHALVQALPIHNQVTVVGSDVDGIPACNRAVQTSGDVLQVSHYIKVTCLLTPCHTRGHVCYVVEDARGESHIQHVFTGDTLFIAGCGKFFEGNAQEMDVALQTITNAVLRNAKIWCGHEYTVKNLQFAATVETQNADIKEKLTWAELQIKAGKFTVPSTIEDELKTNPFMRVREPALQKALGVSDPIQAMDILRTKKNNF